MISIAYNSLAFVKTHILIQKSHLSVSAKPSYKQNNVKTHFFHFTPPDDSFNDQNIPIKLNFLTAQTILNIFVAGIFNVHQKVI
jgi:hypothetical protein